MLAIAVLSVFLIGAGIGIYAWLAPRRVAEAVTGPPVATRASTEWTFEAGDEFGELSEAERCDMVFAVAALDDDRAQQLLHHALSDPAETVATAAAHVLATTGRRAVVETYLAEHPGERAMRIDGVLALLR